MPTQDEKLTLPWVVEQTVLAQPSSIALEFADDIRGGKSSSQYLTYSDLNTTANKLAHLLIGLGVLPDELVCVCMEKSPLFYCSILAILKAGAGYLPLTPDTPKERIRQILENSSTKVCISTTKTSPSLNMCGIKLIEVNTLDLCDLSPANPDVSIKPSNLSYAVFTSGSTGTPKGVLVTQENIVSNLIALKKIYPVSSESRLLQFCSPAFDGEPRLSSRP